jgi:hypothetical protein
MRDPSPLPATLANVPFSTTDAAGHGVSRGRTRARDLASPFRGIRIPSSATPTARVLAYSYAARMPPDQFFSSITAAQLLGLPLPFEFATQTTLHVSAFDPARPPRMAGVVGHHAHPDNIRTVVREGLRMSSPVDTWCQLAEILSLDELICIGDCLVRRQKPLATIDGLRAAVAGSGGRRGARRLREALELVRAGVDSPKETELRLIIVRLGLPEPEVNAPILNRFGAFIAFGDLVYRTYRILVEYDGEQHFDDVRQYHRDIDPLDEVMDESWRVIRINKSHLRRPAVINYKIRTALLAAGWRP